MEETANVSVTIKKKKSCGKIYFGVNPDTGELMSIDDVSRGLDCHCVCCACNTRMVARKGKIRVHHFAHETNVECLYGPEISLYNAFSSFLQKEKHLYLPKAVLNFPSKKRPEIASQEKNIELTGVKLRGAPEDYPPELLCYKDDHCIQIVLNIEHYYNENDYQVFRESAENRNVAILAIDIDNLERITSMSDIAHICNSSENKRWIYNRLIPYYAKKYKEAATAPHTFLWGFVCPAQKKIYNNIFFADKDDCNKCQYCYDIRAEKFCLATHYINHISDFKETESNRKEIFEKENGIQPIKRIEEYSCPKCGAPMKRCIGKNGVFAGCSKYRETKCSGSYNVEQATEQVIIKDY